MSISSRELIKTLPEPANGFHGAIIDLPEDAISQAADRRFSVIATVYRTKPKRNQIKPTGFIKNPENRLLFWNVFLKIHPFAQHHCGRIFPFPQNQKTERLFFCNDENLPIYKDFRASSIRFQKPKKRTVIFKTLNKNKNKNKNNIYNPLYIPPMTAKRLRTRIRLYLSGIHLGRKYQGRKFF